MNILLRLLNKAKGRHDVVLAMLLVTAVFMMILPLPTTLVDFLIAFNLTISVILLMIAIYINEPLEFSVFPSVLLLITLYRLALSISTTRLILLQHDAGEIVYTFGNLVVGGNIIVGLIVFTIITIVQFIVITKGSERVAEVGARFSLDAMPGKQMSIDGDMRAGTIDSAEAKRLRGLVQKESQLYGAMDGAMKFVKGDAIAGIITILVNILGGISIGVFQKGMTAGEATELYSILSVGDGLISQIPDLLISITAGIIVTRVPGDERQNLATELTKQFSRHPRSLWIGGGMLILFGMLPGFPKLVFFSMSLALVGLGYWLTNRANSPRSSSGEPIREGEVDLTPGAVPLIVLLPEFVSKSQFQLELDQLGVEIFEGAGLTLPIVELKETKASLFLIKVYQETVFSIEVTNEHDLVLFSETSEEGALTGLRPLGDPLLGHYLYWSEQNNSKLDQLEEKRFVKKKGVAALLYFLERVVKHYGKEFSGIQETRYLMDAMEGRYGELIKELQRQVQISRVADVLRRLVSEWISIRDLRTIFETMIIWSSKEKDVVVLTEYVRIALSRHIFGKFQNKEKAVSGFMIGSSIENKIRESIRQSAGGSYSTLPAEVNRHILREIKNELQGRYNLVLFTALDVRRYLRKIIEKELFDVHVLSFQELEGGAEMDILGTIEFISDVP